MTAPRSQDLPRFCSDTGTFGIFGPQAPARGGRTRGPYLVGCPRAAWKPVDIDDDGDLSMAERHCIGRQIRPDRRNRSVEEVWRSAEGIGQWYG